MLAIPEYWGILSTRVPPPKVICFNSQSWDHPSTVNVVCNKMRMISKRQCTDRRSEYTSYSQYTALIESIFVLLRVLAVLAAPVLAVTTGRITASTWQYPQYRSLKYLKYRSIQQAENIWYSSPELRNTTSMTLSAVHNLEISTASTRDI